MTGPEPDFPFRFTCRRSGNCCSIPGGFVRVTPAEGEAIAGHLGMAVAAFRSRYLDPDGERLVAGSGPGCVFLVEGRETSCGIYPVRPGKCRTWPYWEELRGNPAAVRRAAAVCPGIECGPPVE